MADESNINRRELLGAAAVAAAGVSMLSADQAEEKPMPLPDAIFIGAGINSLGAAYLLGKAGWRVLVLDRNEQPGGAVRTLELTLPGYKHDIGAMNLTVLANSPFFAEHKTQFAKHGVEFIKADHCFGSIASDGRFLGITTDRDVNVRAIADFSQADADAWKTWSADFDSCAPTLFRILSSPAAAGGPLEYLFGKGEVPEASRQALRGILLDSLRHNLTTRFKSDVVQAMIAAWGLHLDYAPDITGGCWMPFLETNVDERQGISLVKGGSGNVIHALCEMVRETGGEVRTSQTVEKIFFDKDRAEGVQLASGESIRCNKAVVASVTPTALLKLADGHLPTETTRQAQKWSYGPGTMVIHLALEDLPNWKACESARKSFYVHLAPSLDYLAAAYQEGMAGILTTKPFCVVGQPTAYDFSRAPAGKHVLWVMVRAVPSIIRGDAAGEIQGPDWTDEVKSAFADRVLDVIEDHAPGFRKLILGKKIISPSDLEQLNPNLVGGDLNAGSMQLAQFYGQRPFQGASRSPLPGLHLCGASTWPGGGAYPASGIMLAEDMLGAS
ncbi:phytoene desaturase family protein [Bythopirellula goksoeyrii]|uniref:Pyridine nucleotide-disulfide oxidoreductase domain-containing protein 2 n=1 Tax=Bythopirellula goksoeyrii TaxID=1400387 RepID=A0A5B9Q985_9BACT|nr:NAD(P)/FAD-dependent oxidoreductase [Bythopirellula goksoeyrii]QEG34190.1 All-trans-zeta-carotene desaturase [Bythopirellula goksoeyrii]